MELDHKIFYAPFPAFPEEEKSNSSLVHSQNNNEKPRETQILKNNLSKMCLVKQKK